MVQKVNSTDFVTPNHDDAESHAAELGADSLVHGVVDDRDCIPEKRERQERESVRRERASGERERQERAKEREMRGTAA